MEADDTAELEVNDELIGMISGTFGNTSNVEERQDSRELLAHVENLEEEEITELPEHRFVMKEEKTTLFIGDYIFRRRYVRGDLATFICTGCEKISRKTPGGNKVKKEASAVAQISDDGYLLVQVDEEHKCWDSGFRVKIKEAVEEMYSKINKIQ